MNFGLREKSGCLWKVEVEGVNKCLAHGTESLKNTGGTARYYTIKISGLEPQEQAMSKDSCHLY
jgi:hypothetical protein